MSVRNDVQCAFGRAVFLAYVVRMLRDPDGKKHPREGEHAPHTPRTLAESARCCEAVHALLFVRGGLVSCALPFALRLCLCTQPLAT